MSRLSRVESEEHTHRCNRQLRHTLQTSRPHAQIATTAPPPPPPPPTTTRPPATATSRATGSLLLVVAGVRGCKVAELGRSSCSQPLRYMVGPDHRRAYIPGTYSQQQQHCFLLIYFSIRLYIYMYFPGTYSYRICQAIVYYVVVYSIQYIYTEITPIDSRDSDPGSQSRLFSLLPLRI